MKIFYLSDYLCPYRTQWLNLLADRYEITAYYFDAGQQTRDSNWLNSVKNDFKKLRVNSKVLFGIRFSSAIFKILRKNKFDIYIIDGYASLVQVAVIHRLTKRNKTVFVNVDGIDIWKKVSVFGKLKGIIKSGLYRSGASFICGSEIARDRIIASGAKEEKVFKHPFTSIYQSDIITFEDKIRLQAIYKEKINAKNKKVVLAVGRFIPLKRHADLIKAWQSISDDCVLYLIGSGKLKKDYEKLVADLSIKNIIILDHMSKAALDEYYTAADLFVHTSSTEAWGLVFNEAMAKGCPVISTNHCVGGVELVKSGKNGYIVKVGDTKDLHNRILEILSDDELRAEMMKNSIETIKPYTYENMAKAHIEIFRELTENDDYQC